MKPLEVELWSRCITKVVRRSRSIRRAESRIGTRRPNLATRADVWALVRALEASRGEEVAQ